MEHREIEIEGARACGRIAYRGKLALTANPYNSADLRVAWIDGWQRAEQEAVRQPPPQPVTDVAQEERA